jgi:hypothetical protein
LSRRIDHVLPLRCSIFQYAHRDPKSFIALTISQKPEKIEVKHEEVTDQNAIEWASRSFDSEIDASARIL